MGDERVAWFRQAVADWNSGRRDLDWDRVHPDYELDSALLGGVVTGQDGLRTWFEEIDQQFDAWELRVKEEHQPESDQFLVVGEVRLRGRGSGLEMDQTLVWLLRFEGEQLIYMKTFTSLDEASKETGVELGA